MFSLWNMRTVFTCKISIELNQRRIKRSSKEFVTWKYLKFWPMKKISEDYKPINSLVVVCLQYYREYLSLTTFHWVHSNTKEVSYLPWQNKFPSLKTTYHYYDHVFQTNIVAYYQQNQYVRFALYTDLFTLKNYTLLKIKSN